MAQQQTKRLFLPGGGSFDLPMPPGMTENVQPRLFGAAAEGGRSTVLPILGGAVLGALFTCLFLRISR